jgi:hypothetical protein
MSTEMLGVSTGKYRYWEGSWCLCLQGRTEEEGIKLVQNVCIFLSARHNVSKDVEMFSEVLFHLRVGHFWFEVEFLSKVLYLLQYGLAVMALLRQFIQMSKRN